MKTTFTPFPADNAWTRPLVHARDRYFGSGAALDEARSYVIMRRKDLPALQRELSFKLVSIDVMMCHIYGHTIELHTDNGSGTLTTNGCTYEFVNMVQALAYILAVNW